LSDGRTLRTFNVLDDYNREATFCSMAFVVKIT
jgi:hypothetical protein